MVVFECSITQVGKGNIMARINKPTAFRVDLIEYERGWGSKIDETIYFDYEAEALQYTKEFNSKNNDVEVTDWYMIADYRGAI
jgi:hypothetical protein